MRSAVTCPANFCMQLRVTIPEAPQNNWSVQLIPEAKPKPGEMRPTPLIGITLIGFLVIAGCKNLTPEHARWLASRAARQLA